MHIECLLTQTAWFVNVHPNPMRTCVLPVRSGGIHVCLCVGDRWEEAFFVLHNGSKEAESESKEQELEGGTEA